MSSSTEMSWYVVHTYSGYENKAKLALEERVGASHTSKTLLAVPGQHVPQILVARAGHRPRGARQDVAQEFFERARPVLSAMLAAVDTE